MHDDWLWTGDVGFIDADGYLTIVDRSKDMLISGGENVYPAEIENALYQHEAVAECAVFGIPDDRWGEVPAAHVVLKAGMSTTGEALVEFCARRISRHKRPRLVKLVPSLPRTPVGKIQKSVLREPYWQGRDKKI
jgi:acyl-CoA synthetase (AMP-forming)/AMP-acid ligase II